MSYINDIKAWVMGPEQQKLLWHAKSFSTISMRNGKFSKNDRYEQTK